MSNTEDEQKVEESPPCEARETLQLVQLRPCQHIICNDCFVIFPTKLKTDKCPACTQPISSYVVLTKRKQKVSACVEDPEAEGVKSLHEVAVYEHFNQSEEMSFPDLLASHEQANANGDSDVITADCLDHAYFLEEIKQLLSM